MYLSVIGASGGGGGGPVGTVGIAGCTGTATTGGGGGGGGGLKRNRLRSAVSGLGRSPFRASRCTTGGAVAVPFCDCLGAFVLPALLDVRDGAADVPGHI